MDRSLNCIVATFRYVWASSMSWSGKAIVFLLYLYDGIFFLPPPLPLPRVRPFPHFFSMTPLVPSSDETEMGIGEMRVNGDENTVYNI